MNGDRSPGWTRLIQAPRARRWILATWLAVTAAAAVSAIAGFRIDNSVGIWFETDDPALAQYRTYLRDFGRHEWMLVGLEPATTQLAGFTSERDELVSRLRALSHVHSVVSAGELPAGSELVRDFLHPDPMVPDEALLLQVTNDIDTQDGYREELLTEIRSAASGLKNIEAVHAAGIAVINGELNRAARRDMILFIPAVTLFLTLLGVGIFRNVRDTVVLLSISLGTVVVTQGLLIGLGNSLNMVTIMLPTVLIALSVADAIHLIHSFHEFHAILDDPFESAARAVREIAWPCAGTTLTTVAGFLAFSRSSVVPIFQLAIFASFGIGLAYVLTMTVGPMLLAQLWNGRRRTPPPAISMGSRFLSACWRLVDRHAGWVVLGCAVSGLALFGLCSLRADTDYVKFFREGTRVPADYVALQSAGFPQNPINLVVRVPPGADLTSERYWAPLGTFSRRLRGVEGIQATLSPFTDTGLPPAAGLELAHGLRLYDADAEQTQFVVMTDYPSSQWLNGLLERIDKVATETLPRDMTLTVTGTSILWAHMDEGVIRTQKESLLIVSFACFAILAMLFRSLGLAALGLAFSLFPVGIVLGLMGLWGVPVNIATVLIAGIAVGLAVDDTIHFVHAFQEATQRGVDPRTACAQSVESVGLRMLMTSIILVGAFAIMGLSSFMPTSQFGLLSSLTIILALLADLTFLPTALSATRYLRSERVRARPAPDPSDGGHT
jgi:uncharacterized protein